MTPNLRAWLSTNQRVRTTYEFTKRLPGAKALLLPIRKWMFPASRKVRARVASGLAESMILQFDPRFHGDYVGGKREPEFQQLMQDSLRRGDTFVDVGAHIGFFVLCAASLVGPDGHILALEPDPDNWSELLTNIELNGLKHVEAKNVAAWNSPAMLDFKRSGAASGLAEGQVVTRVDESPPTRAMRVSGVRLDDMLADPPALVKIDAEGAEVEVLRGAGRIVAARQTVWAVECHSLNLARAAEALFQPHGYDVRRLAVYESGRGDWVQVLVTARPPSAV